MIQLCLVADLAIIAFAVVLGLSRIGNPSRYFGEGRFTTFVSAAQLLATAYFAARIYFARQQSGAGFARTIWILIAAGFVFLAADDLFQIHEQSARLIRIALGRGRPTAVTRHIDDALIAVYGLVGLTALWICRRELLAFRCEILPPLIAGFVVMLASVICDASAHPDSALQSILHTGNIGVWLDVGDGAFTLIAEGLFLAAFYAGYRQIVDPAPASVGSDARR
jgi:hypothetical protein